MNWVLPFISFPGSGLAIEYNDIFSIIMDTADKWRIYHYRGREVWPTYLNFLFITSDRIHHTFFVASNHQRLVHARSYFFILIFTSIQQGVFPFLFLYFACFVRFLILKRPIFLIAFAYIYTLKEWNLQFRPLSTRSTVTFVQQVEYFKFRVSAIDDEVKTSFSVQLNPRLWVLDHARLLSG